MQSFGSSADAAVVRSAHQGDEETRMSEPDPILVDDWHAIVGLETLRARGSFRTRLLSIPIGIDATAPDDVRVVRCDTGAALPARIEYGYVFASLGDPAGDVVHFPESREADRIRVSGSSVGVHVSGLRAVENFLDLGHFPFVHTNYLGVEPYTEVEPYQGHGHRGQRDSRDRVPLLSAALFTERRRGQDDRLRIQGLSPLYGVSVQGQPDRAGAQRFHRAVPAAGHRGAVRRAPLSRLPPPRTRRADPALVPAVGLRAGPAGSWKTRCPSGCRSTPGPKSPRVRTRRRSPIGAGSPRRA